MSPSNPAKFGIAFALGLVVALAGVTVYVKTSGVRVGQPASVVPSVALTETKQPETLTAPKLDATPAPAASAVQPTPAPKSVATPKVASPALAAPSFRPKVTANPPAHIVRARYSSHSYPESQSTIRVEVSQLRQPSDYPASQTAIPVQANQPIRTVDEDQARPVVEPPAVQQQQPTPVAGPMAPQPHSVTLHTGTNLSIRLAETLSTDHNFSGDTFRATLDRPVILDGFIIAEKGSKVLGKIASLDKGGKFEGGSNMQLSLTEINTTDGQHVRIQTSFVMRKGPSSNGSEVAKVGGGAVLGAIIGGLAGGGKGAAIGAGAGGAVGAGAVMAGKGRPAVLATETQLSFQLSAPTTIVERLN